MGSSGDTPASQGGGREAVPFDLVKEDKEEAELQLQAGTELNSSEFSPPKWPAFCSNPPLSPSLALRITLRHLGHLDGPAEGHGHLGRSGCRTPPIRIFLLVMTSPSFGLKMLAHSMFNAFQQYYGLQCLQQMLGQASCPFDTRDAA